jgi:uncharacterized protein (TIRG00374 family)
VASILRICIGSLLGAAGLWLTLRDVPEAALRDVFSRIDPVLGLLALASTLVGLLAVVARWRLLLGIEAPRFSLLFRATVIGQMLNIVVPLRVGEVARAWAASARGGVSIAGVTGSLAIEKAVDLIIFGASTALVVFVAVVPTPAMRPVRWIVLPAIAAVGLAAAFFVARWLGRSNAATSSEQGLLATLRRAFVASAAVIATPAAVVNLLGLSLIVLATAAGANQLLLAACGIDVPWWTGLAVLVVLQAGTVPPALPGRLGVYNYLTVLTLATLGVDAATAAAYSIALYAIAYLPKLLLGAIFIVDPAWRPARLNPLGS